MEKLSPVEKYQRLLLYAQGSLEALIERINDSLKDIALSGNTPMAVVFALDAVPARDYFECHPDSIESLCAVLERVTNAGRKIQQIEISPEMERAMTTWPVEKWGDHSWLLPSFLEGCRPQELLGVRFGWGRPVSGARVTLEP